MIGGKRHQRLLLLLRLIWPGIVFHEIPIKAQRIARQITCQRQRIQARPLFPTHVRRCIRRAISTISTFPRGVISRINLEGEGPEAAGHGRRVASSREPKELAVHGWRRRKISLSCRTWHSACFPPTLVPLLRLRSTVVVSSRNHRGTCQRVRVRI